MRLQRQKNSKNIWSFKKILVPLHSQNRNGTLADRLGNGLQNRVEQFDSARYLKKSSVIAAEDFLCHYFRSVNDTFWSVNDTFRSVNDMFRSVNDTFRSVNDTFRSVNDTFRSVKAAFHFFFRHGLHGTHRINEKKLWLQSWWTLIKKQCVSESV